MSPLTASAGTAERTFRAMASTVAMTVVGAHGRAESAFDDAQEVFRDVERTCSRFDPASALSRANAAPGEWHEVPGRLLDVIEEAVRAHRATGGLFDPRVHDALVGWGYDASLPFAGGSVVLSGRPGLHRAAAPGPWRPRVDRSGEGGRLHLGGSRIDLGGIGKGLAVRWAVAALARAGTGAMVDAGGDLAVRGTSPDGGPWLIGVEDPVGGAEPVLVLALAESGCATSSTRLRRWRVDGRPVHHLVDPRTGQPGGAGLVAVSVADPDPAWAEVWSKTLFLVGPDGVRARAETLGLAAAWIRADGTCGTSSAMDGAVRWRRPPAGNAPSAGAGPGSRRPVSEGSVS